MTTFTAAAAASRVRRSGWVRAGRVGRWVVRIVLSAQFVVGGMLKLTANPAMVAMFDDIGAGQWLRLFIGVCEVAGAVGVLIPHLARLAAAGLAGLMVGAAITNVVALQISPAVPLVLLTLAVLVAATRTHRTGSAR
jgi:putative oxidoreductase